MEVHFLNVDVVFHLFFLSYMYVIQITDHTITNAIHSYSYVVFCSVKERQKVACDSFKINSLLEVQKPVRSLEFFE